jgi:CHAT domain
MPDLLVNWTTGLTWVGWTFDKGTGPRTVPIPRHAYHWAPSHLRRWRAFSRFQAIATSKQFRDWWLQECGGDDRALKRFMLWFPAGVWDVPWELLIGELHKERRPGVSIVRGLANEPATLPSRFDRPMSILLIKGDDGSKTGWARLNLDRESSLLLESYDRLPASHQAVMSRPRVMQPTESELQALFQNRHSVPDVIFLSGHGSNRPPAFILADGSLLTPDSLTGMLSATPVRPMFVVFWACDTARAENDSRESPSAPFFAALLRSGISSLLAMQAPVKDRSAILLAQELFQSLAGGDALDAAAARARSTLLDAWNAGAEGVDSIDWACPVVWSSGLSAARLAWRSRGSRLAHMQAASRRARLDREGRVFFPPSTAEIDDARRISASRRCWIIAEKLAEHRERWTRLLLAIQTIIPRYVVAVELDDNTSAEDSLRDWAEELQQTLEPSDASADFRSALELIRKRPHRGWIKLCSLPDTIISIWNPPRYSAEDWFWGPLAATTGPVIVAAVHFDGAIVSTDWSLEELDMQYNQARLDAARAEAPDLANALALLNLPIPKASIEATGSSIDGAPELVPLVIETAANEIVLAASAARYFREQMTEVTRQAGHRACMSILAHTTFATRLTPAIREQRLLHCLGATENQAATEEACALLVRYRALDRPRAALAVFERLGSLWRNLPPHLLIIIAWAHAMLGDMEQAGFWLNRSSANDVFEDAWRWGLQSEIDKARGDRDAALQDIDEAIAVLEATPASEKKNMLFERRLRSYRQDRARILQYLFYDTTSAEAEYRTLLDEWAGADDAALDVAIVLRNYSECVRTGHQPGQPQWQQGKDMLDEAAALLANNKDHPAFAEVEYEKARVASAEQAPDARARLEAARDAAATSGHLMLLAIVNVRMFWKFEELDLSRWIDLDAGLSAFPRHGWAVRTLVDGRLRAAKRTADTATALQLIESSRQLLSENPALSAGSDRFRIAASAAGHDVLAAGSGAAPRWAEFLALPWAAGWLQDNGLQTAVDVWGRVP